MGQIPINVTTRISQHNNDSTAHPNFERMPSPTSSDVGKVLTVVAGTPNPSKQWVTPTGGTGGGIAQVKDATDVTVTSPVVGQSLTITDTSGNFKNTHGVYHNGTGMRSSQTNQSSRVNIGTNAVDLQMSITSTSQVASGSYAVISGGTNNTANSSYAAVLGGTNNTASNSYAAVLGGSYNTASGSCSVVSGSNNSASNSYAVVAGGYGNKATGNSATVLGGQYNTASGTYSTIVSGRYAEIDQSYCAGVACRNSSSDIKSFSGWMHYTLAMQTSAALAFADTSILAVEARVVFQDAYGNYTAIKMDIGIAYSQITRIRATFLANSGGNTTWDVDTAQGASLDPARISVSLLNGKLLFNPGTAFNSATTKGSVELHWNIVGGTSGGGYGSGYGSY